MESNQLKAIIMAILSPTMTSRAINNLEIKVIGESADKIIEACNGK